MRKSSFTLGKLLFFLAVIASLAIIAFCFGRGLGKVLAQTQVTPNQVRGGVLVRELRCQTPAGGTCTGIFYLEIVHVDGSTMRLIGVPPDASFTPGSDWKVYP